jgi:hypothetical protein
LAAKAALQTLNAALGKSAMSLLESVLQKPVTARLPLIVMTVCWNAIQTPHTFVFTKQTSAEAMQTASHGNYAIPIIHANQE